MPLDCRHLIEDGKLPSRNLSCRKRTFAAVAISSVEKEHARAALKPMPLLSGLDLEGPLHCLASKLVLMRVLMLWISQRWVWPARREKLLVRKEEKDPYASILEAVLDPRLWLSLLLKGLPKERYRA